MSAIQPRVHENVRPRDALVEGTELIERTEWQCATFSVSDVCSPRLCVR